jgi:probable F420-dependent oxidoreductase
MTCAEFQRIARTAEEVGLDSIVVSEHLALPVGLVPKMGAEWPHALTAMAFIAGATTRITVNSMSIVLPYHHPVSFAKAISTLDVLSGGRLTVTLSVGMAREEFAALGVPFEKRGRITDEYVVAMKHLWSGAAEPFEGEFVQFADVLSRPRPVQEPHPPLWFGGRSRAAMLRAARHGDGWAPGGALLGKGPWFENADDLPALLEEMDELRADAELRRPFDVFLPVVENRIGADHTLGEPSFTAHSTEEIVDRVGRLEELGVTWSRVSSPTVGFGSLEAFLEHLHWIGEEILPACRRGRASVSELR